MATNYPIAVPSALNFRNTHGRNITLTSIEVDGNFAFLDKKIDAKLDASEFNAEKLKAILLSDSFRNDGGLDAAYLRGLVPASNNTPDSIVSRNGDGDFYANVVHANLDGNAKTATDAKTAEKLKTEVKINGVAFDGSKNIDISDSSKLALNGGLVTGKISISSGGVPLNLTPSSNTPATAVGDIFLKTDGVYANTNGSVRKLAFIDSDISGKASGLVNTLPIISGGTGGTTPNDALINLGAAKSGANSDITSLSALVGAIPPKNGGTGLTHVGNNGDILVSNGNSLYTTSLPSFVTPYINNAIGANMPNAVWQYINSSANVHNYAQNGFYTFPGGFTLNWGVFNISGKGWSFSSSKYVNFAKPFSTSIIASWTGVNGAAVHMVGTSNRSLGGMSVNNADDKAIDGFWFAIGV